MLILTGFEDAYYEEPGLIVIPEGQEHEHAGKSAFLDLITGAPFKVTWWQKLVCVCDQIMQVKLENNFMHVLSNF